MKFIAQGKGKFHSKTGHEGQWESRCIALLFNLCSRWGWDLNVTPQPLYSRYPLYRGLGRPLGRSGRMQKISPPRGPAPRTIQSVMRRCHKGNTCNIDSNISFPSVYCCINHLKTKRRQFYFKTQFVPRSKHF